MCYIPLWMGVRQFSNSKVTLKVKVKVGFLYSAARCTIVGSGSWLARANGAAAQTAAIQLHALKYNWTRVMQLANTPPLQSTTLGFQPVSIHQTSPPVRGSKHPITAYYSIYRPRKDERLSWPSWLTCSGRFYPHKWSPISCRSSAGRGKFADKEQRPTFCRCATQPTSLNEARSLVLLLKSFQTNQVTFKVTQCH